MKLIFALLFTTLTFVSCNKTQEEKDLSGPSGSGDRKEIEFDRDKKLTGPPGSGDRNQGDNGGSNKASVTLPTSN